ncbi:MAG TPA: serine/threonine-protein kinase, partial [Polyangiaceae bacterium]|nr:serine/threonine-protein kinase [Polyangiaceae bacterium]
MSEPLVGDVVDTRYELRRLIARGGMSLVFEAHHKFTRRAVALKLLPEELRGKRDIRGRLLREAYALTAVRHPGFVEVLDAGVCGEHGPYVVLEMLEGRTLDGILAARRRLPVADTVQVARQVCEAVAHANARGVVHRDVKPSNVFVARSEIGEETVKLIDLGVAAVAEERLEENDRKLTQAHEVVGTPEYMAPEQLWGREIDARTDVYAIGMSLFECLTGEVPYVGSYPDVLVQVAKATEPPSVRDAR